MLHYLDIKNYRFFTEVSIPKLARVNLFSGKNNAGKSSFLEAVYLHSNGLNEQSIYKVLSDREEVIERGNNNFYLSPLRHFFANHKIDIENFKELEISSNIDKTTISLGYSYIERDAKRVTRQTIDLHSDNENRDILLEDAFALSLLTKSENTERSGEFPLYQDTETPFDGGRLFRRSLSDRKNILLVPSSGSSFDELGFLWDNISLTDSEKYIVNALKIIESRVTGIAMIQQRRGSPRRTPVVKLKHIDDPVTLKSLGDGMGRIFHIILSLANCSNGILLIDEFENGLHWSVQEKVWEIIFNLSNSLKVQVFCTSHSRDCILSFKENWLKRPDSGMFYRIENNNGEVVSKQYDLESLNDSLEFDVEVR
ncbi:AAA family ATPase [Pectobacterium carotovorum]|uniref:AAA family ATPase n=1 Tax=Pectobacterium carotovorum TaxID=554 RepID=UPI002A7EEF2E|nr:AAA family ATPase [Pectobacterium carotovorum]MDY4373524.1 AAA family ATPase [Pectobacterium carotovorum subsp. carotovorum]